ncbi:hypothetical protein C8Q70DRAFT_292731 [Cubamyces menziesii]|nr:hypothetical protein C8Q70DRAFT_292731 [Cubamyces menziesii]
MISMHPSSMPYLGGQGQEWTQQHPSFSPPESRTQTVYSANAPWEQWSSYSQTTWNQAQPGYTTPPPAPHGDLAYHASYPAPTHMPAPEPQSANFRPVSSISPGDLVPPAHSEPFTNVARAAAAAALSPGNVIGSASQAPAAPITAAFMVPPSPSPPPTGIYAAARPNVAEQLGQRSTAPTKSQARAERSPGDPAHAAGLPADVYSGIDTAQHSAPLLNASVSSVTEAPTAAHAASVPTSEGASLPLNRDTHAPSSDSPELTRRMHGGMMEYDGKESRLTSGRCEGAVNAAHELDHAMTAKVSGGKADSEAQVPSTGTGAAMARTGSDSDDGQRSNASSASPPAYVP